MQRPVTKPAPENPEFEDIIVEQPELIADHLLRFANLCGPKSMLAGADNGFSLVMWAKFQADLRIRNPLVVAASL